MDGLQGERRKEKKNVGSRHFVAGNQLMKLRRFLSEKEINVYLANTGKLSVGEEFWRLV